ncbi:hypothetical protein PPL_02414 [Heterostelium album PN500]|uniref:SSD domain-containing protein n=1 Tax=Heterostelium pallidum (strain ATCC 26659 / Pp 5 / PN500) TaxID=670386 RepID=D3AZN2_HETP5|nr:hypothetical protein PPL_02414 [Heterostelium album PN500]EFA85411.1 hypothetical protein PPL_02414 [Heterostelium album PN500]|eukprot:XP_020437520.1 hypothetical protein PPL_02414 [Heterostelium album PN500]
MRSDIFIGFSNPRALFAYKYLNSLVSIRDLLSLVTIPSLTHSDVHLNNPTMGCSMYGLNSNFILDKSFPPFIPDPPIAPGTCQFDPAYSGDVCCNYNQSMVLFNNMEIASGMFGKCSSCMTNVWELWCASSCSPYQSTYMVPTNVNNNTNQIISINYNINPIFAEGLYNSCRDVQTSGGPPFAHFYPTYQEFFVGVFVIYNPAFKLTFVYDEVIGYNGSIIPCSELCSCEYCRDSCVVPTEGDGLSFNKTLGYTTFFDAQVPVLSIWMIYSYVGFILTTFTALSMWMLFNIFKRTQKMKWMILVYFLLIFYLSGIIVPFAVGVAPSHSASCTYQMPYNVEWDCSLALFVAIYPPLVALLIICFTLFLYFFKDRLSTMSTNFNNSNDSGYSNITSLYLNDNSPSSTPPSSPKFQGIGIKDPSLIQKMFFVYAKFIGRHPWWIILGTVVFTIAASIGIIKLQIELDPVKLWVSPSSRSAIEKAYFDEHFGPFYRTEQLIISNRSDPSSFIITYDNILTLMQLEIDLMAITVEFEGKTIEQADLCFQPTKRGCIVESVTGYWQRNITLLESIGPAGFNASLQYCQTSNLAPQCMDAIGVPVQNNVVLGNFTTDFMNSTAFVTTFLLNNQPANLTVNEAWEDVWLAKVAAYNKNESFPFHIAYSAERSVQDELAREGKADIPTILISYSVMFLYVSIALGRYYPFPSRISSIFVNSRFTLGLCGIIIVAFSISISVGICSIIGIKATLIISEVIPFLVLAIGVDNIFILVNTFESLHVSTYNASTRTTTRPLPEETLARALAKVGPSMALASLSESLAFLLGTLTKMPAVVAFSFYASVAIFFDFLIQISAFACLLVMDTRRTESRRIDCLPCVPLDGELSDDDEPEKQTLLDQSTNSTYDVTYKKKDGFLKLIFKKYYAPFLIHPITKVCVCVFFVGLLLTGITYSLQLELGLEQSVALPRDSYLQDYFAELALKLEVGPPFYIVIKGAYNYSSIQDQDEICTVPGCKMDSVANIFNNAPYVEPGISSWLDDYIQWTLNEACLSIYQSNGSTCVPPPVDPNDPVSDCGAISVPPTNRPSVQNFVKFIPNFLNYANTNSCQISGLGYSADVDIQDGVIVASKLDGYHTTLRYQQDFINSMKSVYWYADHFHGDFEIFPYSVFYVYFEQYLTIVNVAILDIGLALVGVLVVSLLILANPIVSLIVVLCVFLVAIDLLGVMALWSVNLNAVSLVNVVMAIGISIEFCVHIAHTFINAPKHYTNDEKAKHAVSEVGSSIVSGIFITKLLGVVVLGFSNFIFKIIWTLQIPTTTTTPIVIQTLKYHII